MTYWRLSCTVQDVFFEAIRFSHSRVDSVDSVEARESSRRLITNTRGLSPTLGKMMSFFRWIPRGFLVQTSNCQGPAGRTRSPAGKRRGEGGWNAGRLKVAWSSATPGQGKKGGWNSSIYRHVTTRLPFINILLE